MRHLGHSYCACRRARRLTIDLPQELEALATATEEARQGTAVATLQDQQLFYVDTVSRVYPKTKRNTTHLPQAGAATPGPTRRVAKPPKTTTKAQAILQAAHRALPVHVGPKRRPKGPAAPKPDAPAAPPTEITTDADPLEAQLTAGCSARVDVRAADPWAPVPPCSGWDAVQPASARPAASQRKRPRSAAVHGASALEVDAAGCSFNPDEDAHQDALAVAVAAEVAKDVQRVLEAPAAPPKRVDYVPETDELALLQVDAVTSDEEGTEGGEVAPSKVVSRRGEAGRKTQRDLNKAKRRRHQEALEVEKQVVNLFPPPLPDISRYGRGVSLV